MIRTHPSTTRGEPTMHKLLLLALLCCGNAAAQQTVTTEFDGAEAPPGSRDFAWSGATWQGGRIRTEGVPGLFASGAFFYEPGADGAEVRFAQPVQELRFFYAHGFGVPAGVATAFAADGSVLGSVSSGKAGVRGAPENFVAFDTTQPVARVRFEGGVVDSASWKAEPQEAVPFSTDVNGAWVNTTHAPFLEGQGILMDYLPQEGSLFLAWFTFAPAQAGAKLGDPQQRWLTAQGDVDGSTASLSLASTSGGVFNRPPNAATEAVGTMTVTLTACDRATVEFAIPGEELSGTFEIARARSLVSDAYPCGSLARGAAR